VGVRGQDGRLRGVYGCGGELQWSAFIVFRKAPEQSARSEYGYECSGFVKVKGSVK
jgi:hypothetical protein